MDTSKLISQAQYARKHRISPQWISHCIKEGYLAFTMIGDIPYINKDDKIKSRKEIEEDLKCTFLRIKQSDNLLLSQIITNIKNITKLGKKNPT